MIRTGLPAELRRWPLRVPTGLRQPQSRSRHSAPKSLDVPIDIPVEMLALPRHYKEPKPSRHAKAASNSFPLITPTSTTASTMTPTVPTVPTSSNAKVKVKVAPSAPVRLQSDERLPPSPSSSSTLSLYPKLSKLIDQVGRLERSFEAVVEAFMRHIDELVGVRPLVVKIGEGEQRYLGSVEQIKARLALQSRSQPSASALVSASSSSDPERHQKPDLQLRARRTLTRKQMTRIDYCLQAVLRHPNGLGAGKRILERLLVEGIVPGQEGLTMVLKGTIRALQGRGQSRDIGLSEDVHENIPAAAVNGEDKQDLLAAQTFCKLLLQRVPYADAHLFNLIVTLQIAARVSSGEIIKLVADYMQVDKMEEVVKWTPQGFDLIMRAYRREGDVRGVRRWYTLYLQSRAYQRRMHEQEQVLQQEEEEGSGLGRSDDVSRPQAGAGVDTRADERARIWPYITMLHANADARHPHRRAHLPRGAYTPSGEHASDIVRHILADELEIPSEVYGYLINRAMVGKDLGMAGRLCEMALQRARANNNKDNKKEVGSGLKPRVWEYCFDLMARSKSFRTRMGGVRGLVKEMIRAPSGPQRGSASSSSSSFASATLAEPQRRVYTAIVREALSNGNEDFPLALWAVERQAALGRQLGLDAKTIDTVARSVLGFAIERNRGEGWVREVLGGEAVGVVCRPGRQRGLVGTAGEVGDDGGRVRGRGRGLSRYRTPGLRRQRGVKLEHWNVVSWRLYRLSVELAERRQEAQASAQVQVQEPELGREGGQGKGLDGATMDRMIYLPLSRPLARLERTSRSRSIDMRRASSIHAQLYDYRWWRETTGAEGIRANKVALGEAVRELLRRGIGARGLIKGQVGGVVDVEAEMRELGEEIGIDLLGGRPI